MKRKVNIWKTLKKYKLWTINEEEPWQIKAARFCTEHQNGFSQQELFEHLETMGAPKKAQSQFFSDTISHPVGSKYGRSPDGDHLWHAPIEVVSMVIDYDELKDARRNAKNAFWLSLIAIIISLITLFVNVLLVVPSTSDIDGEQKQALFKIH